ncbi:MAG: amidohydrolase family protein [Chloroflexi bacterium]|nr:amidohydrolase family protein [Chloroflexota bacterium]
MRIDVHSHVPGFGLAEGSTLANLIDAMDRLEIDWAWVSAPRLECTPTPDQAREANDLVIAALRSYPARLKGYCYINPGYQREALAELERCLRIPGMIGIKLYYQYRANDPVQYPIAEYAMSRGLPILFHAANTPELTRGLEAERNHSSSHAGHIAELARRFPELILIEAHLGGGGDWEWAIKTLCSAPNVRADTSGSVIDDGLVDMAVRELGLKRVVFGTDLSVEAGVGKVLAAELSDAEREYIWWRNAQAILEARRT